MTPVRLDPAALGLTSSTDPQRHCAPEWDFMMSLSDDKQADIIEAFNTTSRYLGDILNINDNYFDTMVRKIYPAKLQLNKANTSDTEATFKDLHLLISNNIVST